MQVLSQCSTLGQGFPGSEKYGVPLYLSSDFSQIFLNVSWIWASSSEQTLGALGLLSEGLVSENQTPHYH